MQSGICLCILKYFYETCLCLRGREISLDKRLVLSRLKCSLVALLLAVLLWFVCVLNQEWLSEMLCI